jgi:hypothetical protein
MSDPKNLTGGCQCGAVRYEMTAPPQWASICHCGMCQKASGQPFMAFAGGKAENLRWTKGQPAFFQSSDIAQRGFCPQCGTPLTYGRKGALSVTICSLDDPAAVKPTVQVGIEGKVAWLDELPQMKSLRTDEWMARAGIASVTSRQHGEKR